MGFTIASWMAYMTMYGVLKASVSAGPSHLAASVTCRPQSSSPSAATAVLTGSRAATTARTRMRTRAVTEGTSTTPAGEAEPGCTGPLRVVTLELFVHQLPLVRVA